MPRVKSAVKSEPAVEPVAKRGRAAAAAAAVVTEPAPTEKPKAKRDHPWKVVVLEDSDVLTVVGTPRGRHQIFIGEFLAERGRKKTTAKMVMDALTNEPNSAPAQYADYVLRNSVHKGFLEVAA